MPVTWTLPPAYSCWDMVLDGVILGITVLLGHSVLLLSSLCNSRFSRRPQTNLPLVSDRGVLRNCLSLSSKSPSSPLKSRLPSERALTGNFQPTSAPLPQTSVPTNASISSSCCYENNWLSTQKCGDVGGLTLWTKMHFFICHIWKTSTQ